MTTQTDTDYTAARAIHNLIGEDWLNDLGADLLVPMECGLFDDTFHAGGLQFSPRTLDGYVVVMLCVRGDFRVQVLLSTNSGGFEVAEDHGGITHDRLRGTIMKLILSSVRQDQAA